MSTWSLGLFWLWIVRKDCTFFDSIMLLLRLSRTRGVGGGVTSVVRVPGQLSRSCRNLSLGSPRVAGLDGTLVARSGVGLGYNLSEHAIAQGRQHGGGRMLSRRFLLTKAYAEGPISVCLSLHTLPPFSQLKPQINHNIANYSPRLSAK